jgi:hypothetical protein
MANFLGGFFAGVASIEIEKIINKMKKDNES